MPAPLSQDLKDQFAKWVAAGGKVAPWCREHGVAIPTAYDWYRAAWFQRRVEAHRRPAVDRAIGRMGRTLEEAIGELGRLVREGADDGIKLGAATTLIDRMIDLQSHAELRAEIRRLEARLSAREPRPRGGRRRAAGRPGSRPDGPADRSSED